jgi:hypothetical protein
VAAVLYVDSRDHDFVLSLDEVTEIRAVLQESFEALVSHDERKSVGLQNLALTGISPTDRSDGQSVKGLPEAIQLLDPSQNATLRRPFMLNFDYADPASH